MKQKPRQPGEQRRQKKKGERAAHGSAVQRSQFDEQSKKVASEATNAVNTDGGAYAYLLALDDGPLRLNHSDHPCCEPWA